MKASSERYAGAQSRKGMCFVVDRDDSPLRPGLCSRPLSLHTVAFGPDNAVLRRMADIATEVQRNVPANPMHPVLPSSYAEALDSVSLFPSTVQGVTEYLTFTGTACGDVPRYRRLTHQTSWGFDSWVNLSISTTFSSVQLLAHRIHYTIMKQALLLKAASTDKEKTLRPDLITSSSACWS